MTGNQRVFADLRRGAERLVALPVAERQRLLRQCVIGVQDNWEQWVEKAWAAKRIPAGDAARAEDILTGPVPTLRYLQLLDQTLDDITRHGRPRLPGEPYHSGADEPGADVSGGRLRVPVFPTRNLFDRLLFGPIKGQVRMPPGVTADAMFGDCVRRASGSAADDPAVTLVLGAGNVSSIPITDTLTKIFQENQAVLLKMNPVNEYVGPVFEKAFSPLIDADLLRIVYGGADVGARLIYSDEIDRIHITGSDRTHDSIVWGATPAEQADRKARGTPLMSKTITSELGNVSPWIIVPGQYSRRQLKFQAENIVASVVSNASFVCIATKMLITCKDWPQRELFLQMIDDILAKAPRRFAYYPGASDRYVRFAGVAADDPERLPWTFRRDVDPQAEQHLFSEESFVCVFGETAITASSPSDFLNSAVTFANDRMWGTLSAALTVPRDFQTRRAAELDQAIDQLRYGIVGVNQWPGVAFALMSTPWGAYPGSTLHQIESGIGSVHNTFLLDRPEKSVISSPLTFYPKPVWFSTHRRCESVARNLLKLYLRPTARRLPAVLINAMLG